MIDKVIPELEFFESDIKKELDLENPSENFITTSRQNTDNVHILPSIFEGKTKRISMLLIQQNEKPRFSVYDDIKY